MLLFQTSREIIFSFQHVIQVFFYVLGKKLGGHAPPPAPPLATALRKAYMEYTASHDLTLILRHGYKRKVTITRTSSTGLQY